MRHLLASALLVAAVATPSLAATEVRHFTRDGDRYSYVADRAADGTVTLNGHVETTGEAFALRVRGAQVDGRIGVAPVSFAISKRTRAQLETEVPAVQQADAVAATLAAN